jgi:hypothetical protein
MTVHLADSSELLATLALRHGDAVRFRIGVGRRDPEPALAAFDAFTERIA